MNPIEELINRDEETIEELVRLWENTVKVTHTFLTSEDIEGLKPEGYEGLRNIAHLYIVRKDDGSIAGFMGVEKNKIEMLFIDLTERGSGLGKRFIQYALNQLKAPYVDVNEQNTQGVGFYLHLGAEVLSRSETDEQGRPFPLLHLKFK